MALVSGKSHADQARNIRTEIKAGRPRAQAIAIAYSKMRQGKKRER